MDSPRRWQQNAKDALWPRLLDRDGFRTHPFKIVTGGGKTYFAIFVAFHALKENLCDRVVFLCPPRANVQKQWREAVELLRAHLRVQGFEDKSRRIETESFTSVAKKKERVGPDTLVIVDEFHHLVRGNPWGINVEAYALNAGDRVMLSATPERDGIGEVPFISRSEGYVYEYSYGSAVTDGVCRYLVAHDDYDGVMTWTERGTLTSHTFGKTVGDEFVPTPLAKQQDARRFATSIKANFTLTQRMIKDAVDVLAKMRRTSPRAQGMIVVASKLDAAEVAEFFRKECKVNPSIVHSDTGSAERDIDTFKKNTGNLCEWMISITLVSEGTDIPNLCVLVYNSRIRTELFMRQVAGRVMRVSKETPAAQAHIFYPKDEQVRNVFRGLQLEADAVQSGETLFPQEAASGGVAKGGPSSSEDDDAEVAAEGDAEWHTNVQDGSSDDGSVDADAQAWESIAADLTNLDDEDAEFKETLAKMLARRPGDDPALVREDVRKACGLVPLLAVSLALSQEHLKGRIIEKFNTNVLDYVGAHKRQLGAPGKKIGRALAREKARLVLRFLKRKRMWNDPRRRPVELEASELQDIIELSIPRRITKLRRLAAIQAL